MPAPPRFWRKIPNRYNLIGTKCLNCGEIFFPPRNICPDCREVGEVENHKLKGRGSIVSYTKVHAPQEGFEDKIPYYICMVELEEGPRVIGQITETCCEDVSIGQEVEVVFRNIGEDGEKGIIHYGYKFRLI